ncbi:Y4171-like protein [Mya arenaria]|uniref:Y4171-like protein n=1 Tax=Mya arenaria TaxID=6604 RepID=A0ABY7E6L1_MYAAR|nr:Y4171-like protein [Mya arenaria]
MIFETTFSTTLALMLSVVYAAPELLKRPPPLDCAIQLCAVPNCPTGNTYTPPGSCCPVCGQDCSLVKCALPVCAKGEERYTPPGACCQQCRPLDCFLIQCALPKCLDGQELYTRPRTCCPICRFIKKVCVHTDGKKYANGETFKDKCNTCTCNDGHIGCTEIACIEKEGSCPKPWSYGKFAICIHMCDGDWDCPDKQKCCSNGCGKVCRIPKRDKVPSTSKPRDPCDRCTCLDGKIVCDRLLCLACAGFKPKGACCPICGTFPGELATE